MGQKYLIDTLMLREVQANILIDAQMNRLSKKGLNFLAKAINDDFIISFITQIEYLGYKNISKTSEEFISLATVVGTDKQIIQSCIDLRKNYNLNF